MTSNLKASISKHYTHAPSPFCYLVLKLPDPSFRGSDGEALLALRKPSHGLLWLLIEHVWQALIFQNTGMEEYLTAKDGEVKGEIPQQHRVCSGRSSGPILEAS